MGYGLKPVRRRREDALAELSWQRVEEMLAEHYRREGYDVEHTGTGGSRSRFDGGIDLKLRRAGEYVVVQVKHWNAYKVPHNEIHQLLGIMVNEGATGAIFATSGEFTKAAIEAATRHDHVRLIDGDDLRAMLGPLPQYDSSRKPSDGMVAVAAERLLSAAEDRIRHGARPRGHAVGAGIGLLAGKVVFLLLALLLGLIAVDAFVGSATKHLQDGARMPAQTTPLVSAAPGARPPVAVPRTPAGQLDPCMELIDARSGTYIDHCASPASTAARPERTPEQLAEDRRRAEDAERILRANTPAMKPMPDAPETTWPRSPAESAR